MRRLMHRHEIITALSNATSMHAAHALSSTPWWLPRAWIANRMAAEYWRGKVDVLREVLHGHKIVSGTGTR